MIGKQPYGGCFLQTSNREEPDMTDDRNPPIPQGWRLEGLLCRGSCSSVYRVIRQSDGAHAALKVIPIPMDDSEIPRLRSNGYDDETISRILGDRLVEIFDKYDLLATLTGEPNIVSIGDVLYTRDRDGSGCTVSVLMEELTPLCETLDYNFSESRAVAIACDLLTALEVYGQHRMVHGAIKPENVLVSDSGMYKLSDFGVSDLLGKRALEIAGDACDFTAPEVFLGKEYDARADVYSVGLLLYWLCNDFRIPFLPAPEEPLDDKDFEEAVAWRMSGDAIPEPKNGSPALKKIIAKACAFNPRDRYTSASPMYRDLRLLTVKNNATVPIATIRIPQEQEQRHYTDTVVRERRPAQHTEPTRSGNRHEEPIMLFEDDFAERRRAVQKRIPDHSAKKKKGASIGFIAAIAGLILVAIASVVVAVVVMTRKDDCSGKGSKSGNATQKPAPVTQLKTPFTSADPSESATPSPIVVHVTDTPTASAATATTATPTPTHTPTLTPSPTPTPTPVPTFIPVPDTDEAPSAADHTFDGLKAQDANFKCCYINPSWKSYFSNVQEELISDDYRLMQNTKVTIRALYKGYALIEIKDGRKGWVSASFLYAAWMHDSTFNPALTQQIKDGLETPLSYEVLGEFLSATTKPRSSNIRQNPCVTEKLDPPMPENIIMIVSKGTRFTLLAQRTVDGKIWYFCMKQATKGQQPVYCWVSEANFK